MAARRRAKGKAGKGRKGQAPAQLPAPKTEEPNKGGRPEHEPDARSREYVEVMSGYGVPQADICVVLGISENTLRKHYAFEIEQGKAKANVRVLETLFRMATSGKHPGPTIFWAKARCGMREPPIQVVPTDPDGKTVRYVIEVPVPPKDDAEWLSQHAPHPTTQ